MSAAIASMTGFAHTEGSAAGLAWAWELRSVNGRGLDLRFRLPPGWDALEPVLRQAAAQRLKRGNVTASLTVKRDAETRLAIDEAALEQALALAMDLHARIPGSPVPRAEALLSLPGVLRPPLQDPAEERASAAEEVRNGFEEALAGMTAARQAEGARLHGIMADLLNEIAALRDQAVGEAADQPAAQRARMLDTLQALLSEAPSLPEERIAQEVALLAARSDVREELDRLGSHLQAARNLLRDAVNIGRRFDFLVQEFNREANTLCSKSASTQLTATGLKLKAAIEQLREQVQNVE
ncbi:MAG: YicC family protein [Acetobacteraceae bacterium]|nr:YicC family protein [Acetobacteraceae bacterium]